MESVDLTISSFKDKDKEAQDHVSATINWSFLYEQVLCMCLSLNMLV